MKIVSACLAGINCQYNGASQPCQKVVDLVQQGKAIPVCPEQLGGLPTPRTPAEIKKGRVVTQDGQDITAQFNKGAQEVLKIAKCVGCKVAILKARSPSCGSGKVYDGTFSRKLVAGDGVSAKLLKNNNIKVLSEEDL